MLVYKLKSLNDLCKVIKYYLLSLYKTNLNWVRTGNLTKYFGVCFGLQETLQCLLSYVSREILPSEKGVFMQVEIFNGFSDRAIANDCQGEISFLTLEVWTWVVKL